MRAERTPTPGPWEWRGDDCDLVNPELYAQWVANGYQEKDWPFVLKGDWHNDRTAGVHVSSEANARLIAAAPDLLAALLALMDDYDQLIVGGVGISNEPEPRRAARLAIAKVEG